MNTKLEEIKTAFEAKNFKVSILTDEMIEVSFKMESIPDIDVTYGAFSDNVIGVRIFSFIKVPSDKRDVTVSIINETNSENPCARFVLDTEDNEIEIGYDILNSTSNLGEVAVEICFELLNAANSSYSSIIETLFNTKASEKINSRKNFSDSITNEQEKKNIDRGEHTTETARFQKAHDQMVSLCQKFIDMYPEDFGTKSYKVMDGLGIDNDVFMYLLHDDTVFKSGKNGFAITSDGIYCRELLGRTEHTSYDEFAESKKIYWKDDSSLYADQNLIAYKSLRSSKRQREDILILFKAIQMIVQEVFV